MPIYDIPQDILDSLADDAKTKLKEYKPEDVTGLKENANRILSEKKELEAKYAQAVADLKTTKVAKDPKADDLQAMLEDLKGKYETTLGELKETQERTLTEKRMSKAREIGTSLAPSDARRAELLAKEVSGRLQLDGDSFIVLSKDGKPTISSLDELKSEVQRDYDFLIDGTGSTGGGSQGGSGGAAGASKQIKRSDFDALDQNGRADFAKSGGKVIDD